MSLTDKINEHMKEAMRAKDEARLRGIRAIKSAILLAQSEKGAAEKLTEEKESLILQKLLKQRKDSLQIYQDQNREDLALVEQQEIDVIAQYMPEMMGEKEIRSKLESIIEKVGASSPADMGTVMGAAIKEFAGKADGKLISSVTKELLQTDRD